MKYKSIKHRADFRFQLEETGVPRVQLESLVTLVKFARKQLNLIQAAYSAALGKTHQSDNNQMKMKAKILISFSETFVPRISLWLSRKKVKATLTLKTTKQFDQNKRSRNISAANRIMLTRPQNYQRLVPPMCFQKVL